MVAHHSPARQQVVVVERERCATSGILPHCGLGDGLLHRYSVDTTAEGRSCDRACVSGSVHFENTLNYVTSSFEPSDVPSRGDY